MLSQAELLHPNGIPETRLPEASPMMAIGSCLMLTHPKLGENNRTVMPGYGDAERAHSSIRCACETASAADSKSTFSVSFVIPTNLSCARNFAFESCGTINRKWLYGAACWV